MHCTLQSFVVGLGVPVMNLARGSHQVPAFFLATRRSVQEFSEGFVLAFHDPVHVQICSVSTTLALFQSMNLCKILSNVGY